MAPDGVRCFDWRNRSGSGRTLPQRPRRREWRRSFRIIHDPHRHASCAHCCETDLAGARGVSTLWEHPRAQWVTAPTLLPLTHSTIVAHGTDAMVTANLNGNGKSNFFVLETSLSKVERLSAIR